MSMPGFHRENTATKHMFSKICKTHIPPTEFIL